MTLAITQPAVTAEAALAVAQADALSVYRNLSPYRIEIILVDKGWKIDYVIPDPTTKGGGPHYVIDADTGVIISKRYEQ